MPQPSHLSLANTFGQWLNTTNDIITASGNSSEYILVSQNATPVPSTGNASVNGTLTLVSLKANSSIGTDGQFLTSNGSTIHWSTLSDANSSVSGLVNTAAQSFAGVKTFTNNVAVLGYLTVGNNTITLNSTTLQVGNSTSNLVINSTSVSLDGGQIINSSGTSNNATNLNGQPASFYTNASNLSTGTVPDARVSGAYTGVTSLTLGANVVANTTTVFIGNSTANTMRTATSFALANSTNTATLTPISLTIGTTIANTTTVTATNLVGNGASVTSVNAVTLDGKTEGTLNVNSATQATNSTNLNSQPASFYTNASNLSTGTLAIARLDANVILTTSTTGINASALSTGTIPLARLTSANSSASGVVDTTAQTFAGNKTFTGSLTMNSAAFVDVTISGNLTASGTTTYINTTSLQIGDNIIALNADLPGATAPTENAGIEINRGSSANTYLRWSETSDIWEVTSDGTNYGTLLDTLSSTGINASALSVGTVPDGRLSGTYTSITALTTSGSVTVGTSLAMAGALTGVTTLATSSTINSQTISSAANFTGTITAAGKITTVIAGEGFKTTGVTTGASFGSYNNTNTSLFVGLNNAAGTALFTGAGAANAAIGTDGNFGIDFATNNAVRMTLSNAGLLTVSGFGTHTFGPAGTANNYAEVKLAGGNGGANGGGIFTIYTNTTFTGAIGVSQLLTGSGSANLLALEVFGPLSDGVNIKASHGSGAIRFYAGGSTEMMRIASSGYVGIGTTSPGANLQVSSSGVPVIALNSTASGAASFRLSGAAGASRLAIGTDGGSLGITERMTIMAEGATVGNVGIGTTGPGQHLTVSGINAQIGVRGTDITSSMYQLFTNSNDTKILYLGLDNSAGNNFWTGGVADSGIIGMGTNQAFVIGTNSLPRLTVAAGGYVGIGTTGPTSPFQLLATNAKSLTGNWHADIRDNTALATGVGGGIQFSGRTTDVPGYEQYAGIDGYKENATSNNRQGALRFLTQPTGGSGLVERVRIDSTGNVGIGTTAPENKLHIYAGSAGTVTAHDQGTLTIESSGTGGINILTPVAEEGVIYFGSPTSSFRSAILYNHTADKMFFRTAGNVTQVTIDNGGRVGIGTTDPGSYKLNVQGSTTDVGIKIFNSTGSGDATATATLYLVPGIAASGATPAIQGYRIGDQSANPSGRDQGLKFYTTNNDTSVTAMTILNDGNVGIGTTTPIFALDVKPGTASTVIRAGAYAIMENVTGDQAMFGRNVQYDSSASGWTYLNNGYATAIRMYDDSGDGSIAFHLAGSGTAGATVSGWDSTAKKMTIRNNGNVGIGTSSPGYQLELSTDSAAKPSTNTWTIASDVRVKTEVRPYLDGLATIMHINPVWYKYNGKAGFVADGKDNIGVIAQDIRGVAPYTVDSYHAKLNPDDDDTTELYNFNSHALAFMSINAIKELNNRLAALEAQLREPRA